MNPTVSFSESMSFVSHAGLPVFMSTAISRPSTVPDEDLALAERDAPRVRRVRLRRDEIVVELREVGPQRTLPVAASSANTRLYEPV